MNIKTHQLFAQLCENIVFEDSSTMDIIKQHPGGDAVIRSLHKIYGLAHDQGYVKTDKMSWSSFKAARKGSWAILKYPRGTGAIKQSSESYTVLASTGGEVETLRETHGGNVMDWLKSKLGGNPVAMYVGIDRGSVYDKKHARVDNKKGGPNAAVSNGDLLQRFKPLWVKAATAAIADIKGMIAVMVKNDSFEKAEHKLGQLKTLRDSVESLETTDRVPSIFAAALDSAVVLAAGHYYPEQTGEIRYRYHGGGLSSASYEGPQQLLKDIGAGDTAKMGTVLSFFKRGLIAR
jgi:hypothetical protein